MTRTTNEDTTQKPTPTARFFNKRYHVFWAMLLYLFFSTSLYGQSPYISVASGNWNDDATWSGSGIPTATDVVQIRGGFTVYVNITNAVCGSLKVGGDNANNNTGTLNFASSGNPVLKISGNLQIGGDGNSVRRGTVIFQSGATLTATSVILGGVGSSPAPGVLSMNNGGTLKTGSLALGAGLATWEPGWGTVELTGTNSIPNTVFTLFYNLIINSGTTTMGAAKSIMDLGTLTLNSGTLNAGTNLSMTTNSTIKRHDGSMTGTLQGSGVFDVSYTGNSKTTGPELNSGGLRNLTINLLAGKTLTLGANGTPDGNLSIINGTFDLSTNTINRSASGGTMSIGNGAFLKIGGTNPLPTNYNSRIFGTTSTVEFYGGIQNITSENFGHLIISAGTKSTSGTISVSGNFTCSNGATVNTANNWNPMAHWTVDGSFNQTNGTTTFSSGSTHEISGAGISQFNNLMTSSSTINANDHSIYLAGNWTHGSSGIFNAEVSTVRFNGAGIQTQPATEFVPSFYNLIVNKGGGTLSSRIWTVTNDFELMLGSFAPNDGSSFFNVTITDGTFTAPSGNINVAGNWTRNGGIFVHGIGKVTFNNASADQSINGSQNAQDFYNLTLIKGSKKLNFSGSISIVAVRNILTMNSGNIDLGMTGILELGASPSSAGTLNYTSGTVINGTTGGFKRWVAGSSEPGIDFPVGTSLNTYKARIIFNNNTEGSLTARFDPGDPGNNTGFPLEEDMLPIYEDGLFTEGTWSLIPESLTSTDYDLELTGTGFTSGGEEDGTVRILKRPDNGGDWILDGMHVPGSGDVAKRSGLSGFSRFAHGRPCHNPATVYAGVDQTICKGGSATLAGTIGGSASSATWSDAGVGGSFSPNNSTLNAVYTPPSGFTGAINLTLTTNNPPGPCRAVSDVMVLTVVADPAAPTATKSPAVESVCAGQTLTLSAVADNGGGTGTCVIEYRFNDGSGFSAWSSTLPSFSAVAGINKIEIRKNCNGAGCDLSAVSTYVWTVVADPVVPTAIQSPDDAIVCAGQLLSLMSVTDNGGGTGTCSIEYRYDNGSGFTTWSTTPASFPAIAGTNTIEIRKNCTGLDCDVSAVSSYTWSVIADPTVEDPLGTSVCFGQSATLSVSPQEGTGDFSYQWQQMNPNCAAPEDVGSDSPSYTTLQLTPGTYYFRCVITQSGGGCDPLTTGCATVVVHPNPSCSITGPSSLCPSTSGTIFEGPPGLTGYAWSISGSGTITGSMTGQSVTVNAGSGCNTSYELTLSATDGNGCTSVCTKTVNVLDPVAPTVTCPTGVISRNTDVGACTYSAVGTEFDPVASFDNCGIAGMTNDYNNTGTLAGVQFPIGTTVVNWTLSDHCSNTATCSITIYVGNEIDPVISCPSTVNPYYTNPGQCFASLSFEAAVSDDCGLASTQYSILGNVITFPYDFAIGNTVVDVLVTDVTGNTAICSFDVIVEDHEQPTVECPKPLYPFQIDAGQCTASLSFSATSSDNCGVATTSYFIGDTPIVFPYNFTVGSTTVYVVVTDVHGNTKTCFYTVVVEDNESPSVECPKPLYPYPVDEGGCTANLNFAAFSSDNCEVEATSYFIGETPISFPYDFPVGSTVVYVVVTDIHDNTTTCYFTVEVVDNINPAITCPVPLSMYTTPPGACHVALSFAATATDNCGVAGTVYSIGENTITFPYEFPVGSTTVNVVVTDIHGNSAACSFAVVVADQENPAVECPVPMNPYTTDAGSCDAILSFAATSTDNCGIASTTYSVGTSSITFPYNFPVGSTVVNAVVTDIHGNMSSCSFTVQVIDQTAPMVICPVPANPYTADEGDCDATLTLNAVAADNCGVAGVVYSINGNAITFPYNFPVGTTVVNVLVTDIHANTAACSYTVVVEDDELPIVNCPQAEIQYTADAGECNTTLSFEVASTDNCGVAATQYKIGGQPITFPYDFPIGSTMVQVYVTDIHGNIAVCTFTIIVEDHENPIIECEVPAASYSADSGDCDATLSFTSTSTDNCGIAGTEYSIGGSLITFPYDFPVGTTEVNAVAVDYSGNMASCFFLVTVTDAVNPIIVCPDPTNPYPTDPDNCHAVLSFEPYATDNCGIASTVYNVGESTIDFPYYFPVGSTIVNAVATDIYGNSASCSFEVIVEDQEHPVVECPLPNNLYMTDAGECNATLGFETFATDNCGITTTEYKVGASTIMFPYDFPVGSTVVTALVTDLQGNITSCSFTVVVEDNQPPVVECPVPANPYAVDPGECNATLSFEAGSSDQCGIQSIVYTLGQVPNILEEELTIEVPPISFPYDFPVGSTVVNVLVTDIYGNTSACSFTVDVVDNEAPLIQCPLPANPYPTDAGTCSAALSFGAEANDNCGIESIVYAINASPISFPYQFPVGSTVVNVLVTDIHGNSGDCSFTVEVIDMELPVVTCPLPAISYSTDPGECNRTLSFGATSSDNCGVATVLYNIGENQITFPYEFPVGSTIVNVLVTDLHGNSTPCEFTVVVEDKEHPVITCPAPVNPYAAEADECSATLSFEAISSDNCGIAGTVYVISGNPIVFPYSFPIGSTAVSVQVTDLHGNISECAFTVVVEDNELPTIICPIPVNTYTVDAGDCNATLSFEATVADNCGVESTQYSVSGNPIAFPYDFPVGVTAVHVLVTDIHGNLAECSFEVIVADSEIPTITCSADLSLPADAGDCSAVVVVTTPAVSDNCGVISVLNTYNGTPDASGIYPVGATTVMWTVTDVYGNTNTCTQTITITDDEEPQIICAPAQSQIADAGQCNADVEISSPATGDNCGVGALINSYNGTADASDNYPVGTTTIIWTLSDIHGNTSTCAQAITISDTQVPMSVCAPDQIQSSDAGECNADVEVEGPLTSDNCGVATVVNSYNNTADASANYPVGTTMVLWTVTDVHGNTSTCVQSITVTDGENPVINCIADQSQTAAEGECFAVVIVLTPSAGDNCGVASVLNSYNGSANASGNYPVGTTTVIWTVTDIHGNTSTCAQLIIITDDEDPSITCAPDQVQVAEPGACSAFVNVIAPLTGDNCGVATLTNSFNGTSNASGNYPVGMTIVLWTITDIHGNTSTCAQMITVTDTEAPVLFALAADISVECDGAGNLTELANWLSAHGGASATDNCGGLTWSDDFVSMSDGCGMTGSIIVVFTVMDQSGNSAQTTASFTIIDTTGPTLTMGASNQVVECNGNGNIDALNAWLNSHGGANANDMCGMVIWSHDFNGLSNSCGETGTAVVNFTATDDCGNAITTNASFTISDTQAPSWINIPVNENEECDGSGNLIGLNAWLSSFTAGDVCGSAVVTHSFVQMVEACGVTGSMVYNFIATDACGNSISNTASFTITDTTDPEWVNMPANQTVQCDGNGNTGELAAWLNSFTADDLCNDVAVTNNFTSLSNLCGATGSATVTFTATDECGNSIQQAAVFSIIDTSNPYWVNEPVDLTVECNGTGNTVEFNTWLNGFTADDNCGSASVTYTFISFNGGCGSTLSTTVNFKATDECGNMITKVAVFTISDTADPFWVNMPQDQVVECDGNGNSVALNAWLTGFTADDACGDVLVTYTFTSVEGECGSTMVTTANFTATDECGNTITKLATFTIADHTIPMITYCPPDVLIACGAESGVAALGNITATDICDANVNISYTDSDTQGVDPELCDYYSYTITRTFTASDACGNSASCVEVISIQDNEAPTVIAGVIDDCYPTVELAEAAALAATTVSDECDMMVSVTVMTGQTSGCDSLITVTATDACGNSDHVTYNVLIGCAVTNTADSGAGSLRNVLTCAEEGAEIAFDPDMAGQTIILTTGEIAIDRNLTLNGLGMPNLTISGNGSSRVFHIMPGYVVTAKNLTLKDGHDPLYGGAVFVEGTLNLENVMFTNNFQGSVPKAITLTPTATLNVSGNVHIKY